MNGISNHFGDRWRYEYVVNLRASQRTSKLNIKRQKGTQTLLLLIELLPSRDSEIRGAIAKLQRSMQSSNLPEINSSPLKIHIKTPTKWVWQGNKS